jgi:hypothetical protein
VASSTEYIGWGSGTWGQTSWGTDLTIVVVDGAVGIGTVGTVPDATSVLLKGATTSAGTLGDGDLIFNINPIKLILTFER